MADENKLQRGKVSKISLSGIFGGVCLVTLVIFLWLLTAVPFIAAFSALTFSGDKAGQFLKVAGTINLIAFCISLQGYLIAIWIENRRKRS